MAKGPTKQECLNNLRMFLANARIHALRASTLDSLARYGCDRKLTEYEFTIALQKRAGEQ